MKALLQTNKLTVNKLTVTVLMIMGFSVVPIMGNAANAIESIAGSTCLVPVIHTDFLFPPEGGKIIKIGEQMYFVQDYRPECANAGRGGQLIQGSHTSTVNSPTFRNTTPTANNNSTCTTLVN